MNIEQKIMIVLSVNLGIAAAVKNMRKNAFVVGFYRVKGQFDSLKECLIACCVMSFRNRFS